MANTRNKRATDQKVGSPSSNGNVTNRIVAGGAQAVSPIKIKSNKPYSERTLAKAKMAGISDEDLQKIAEYGDRIDFQKDMKAYKDAERTQKKTPHSIKNRQALENKKAEIKKNYNINDREFDSEYKNYRNSKESKAEDIANYTNPNYRMSREETKDAKRLYNAYLKNNKKAQELNNISNPNMFRHALEGMSQEDKDEYAKMTALRGKTSNAAAFMTGAVDGIPFLPEVMDKATSYLNDANGFTNANSWKENSAMLSKQSPIAKFGGGVASTGALYGALNPALSKIPVLGKATSAVASGLSKIPGLGNIGEAAIGEFLTDMQADAALDTLPEYIINRRNGMDKKEAGKEALINLAGNAAFNVGGGILNNLPSLKAGKAAENIDDVVKNLDETTQDLAKQNADIIAKETGEIVPTLNKNVDDVRKPDVDISVKPQEAINTPPVIGNKIDTPSKGTNVIQLPGTNGVIELPDTQAKNVTRADYYTQDLKAPEIPLSKDSYKRINAFNRNSLNGRGSAKMIDTFLSMGLDKAQKDASKKERSEFKKALNKFIESGSQADYDDVMKKAAGLEEMINGKTISVKSGDYTLSKGDITAYINDIAETPEIAFKRELNTLVDDLKNENLSSTERVEEYLGFLNKIDQDEKLSAIYENNPELQKYIDEDIQNFINGSEQFDPNSNNRNFSLWDKPVSNEFEEAVSKLERGEHVDNDILFNTPEVKEGERIQAETWENLRKQYNIEDTEKARGLGTKNINPEERVELHNKIKNDIMGRGSARFTTVDGKKKTVYDNPIRTDRRLDIVAGLPASGKSSAIVDDISNIYGSRVHDNDEIKALIPEFKDGWGAGLVHEESSDLSEDFIRESIMNGENIVLPKVGSKVSSLMPIIEKAKKNGYTVNLHYVELPREKAKGRMMSRFASQQRYFKPDMPDKYFDEAGNSLIEKTYEDLKGMGILDGYSKWDNDVKRGESPKLIERSSGDSTFDAVIERKLGNELREGTDLRSDLSTSMDVGRSAGNAGQIDEGIERYSDGNVLPGGRAEGTGAAADAASVGFTDSSLSNAVEDGGKVSALRTNTAPKTGVLTDEELEQHLPKDMLKYIEVSEKESVSNAINMIQEKGAENLTNELLNRSVDTYTSSDVDALMMLWQSVVDRAKQVEEAGGNASELWAKQRAIFKKTQEIGSDYGQVIQSFAKWGRSTPTGMLAYAEKVINGKVELRQNGGKAKNALQKKLDNYIKKNHVDVEFSENFEKKFLNEAEKYLNIENKDSRKAKESFARIGKLVNNEIPSSIPEAIKTILMDNMLGNFRTLITRNAGGNIGYNILEQLKKVPASQIDKLLAKKTGRRTVANFSLDTFAEYAKGVVSGLSDEAKDFKSNLHTARSGENSIDFFDDIIANNRHVFNPESAKNPFSRGLLKVADFSDKLVKHGLAVGDRPFYEGTYRQTLAEYKKLGKEAILGKDFLKGKDPAQTDQIFNELAEECARLNALAAVYQNDGMMSDAFMSMRDGIAKLGKSVFGVDILSQFAMPFVKTPANIIERTLEYTPLGIPKNAIQTAREIKGAGGLKNIDASTQARIANETARNLLGTGLFGGGMALRNANKITGALPDNEFAKDEAKAQGRQEYAWNTKADDGEYNFDISWMPIAGTSLIAGAAAKDAFDSDPNNGFVKNVLNGVGAGANSLFGQSMFQGMQQLFGADQSFNSAEGISENIRNTIKGGASQGIPSLMRQVANTTDKYERDTTGGDYDYSVIAGIPGLREKVLQPKVDAFGNDVLMNQGRSLLSRIGENMISPGKLTKIEDDPLVMEQNRLFDETTSKYDEKKYSQYLDKYSRSQTGDMVGKDAKEMSRKEYHDFAKEVSSLATNLQRDIVDSEYYKSADDDTRAALLASAKTDMKALFKQDQTGTISKQSQKAVEAYRDGGVEAYLELAKAKNDLKGIKNNVADSKKETLIKEAEKQDLTPAEIGAALKAKGKLAEKTQQVVDQYGDEYAYYVDSAKMAYDKIQGKDTAAQHKKQQAVVDYANSLNISDEQKGAIMYATFAKSKQYQAIYEKEGYAGIAKLYNYKQAADTSRDYKVSADEAKAFVKKNNLNESTWVPMLKSTR